ncbi:hypothetical protein ACFPH6_32845 [Streptomyces xiangluensis]|uniref:Uncharacterized protein n=1 Tax=Streptomyces xiangluensis TaxID=2665720 RepID=A0ABV8YYB8_9ACTN
MTVPHTLAMQPQWSPDYALFVIDIWLTAVLRAIGILLLGVLVCGFVARVRQGCRTNGRPAQAGIERPSPLDIDPAGLPDGQPPSGPSGLPGRDGGGQ